MTNLDSVLKSKDITLPMSVHGQGYGLCSSHVQMWEQDHKEGWAPKNWCFQTVVLEKTLESPLDSKEIKSVNLKGNQPWILIGRTDNGSWRSNTLATWYEEPTHWKRPWCWERLWAGGEGDDRWDGWMASPVQWIWTWVNSGRWRGTGKPGVPQSLGSRRVKQDLETEQQQQRPKCNRLNYKVGLLTWC